MCRTGSAITISTAAAAAAEIAGWRSAGVNTADQKRFSPLGRRSRRMNGIRPFSTRSPSFESTAGRTVSEPSIAIPTTTIVAIPNDMYILSPASSMPAIATITVTPEIRTERPEVAAAASSAAWCPRPAARSSRSRLM